MHEWYDENRKMAHDQVVDFIIHTSNPSVIGADPRIIEWARRYADQARENLINFQDSKAKNQAQDNFTHQLTVYELNHTNDLAIKKRELEAQFHLEISQIRQDTNDRISKIREDALEQIHRAEVERSYDIETAKIRLRPEEDGHKPTIQDPSARKKRRGSISCTQSPTILKRQDLSNGEAPIVSAQPLTHPNPQPITPAPPTKANVPDPIMSSMMEMISKQFESLTKRLDRIESTPNDNYTTTWDRDRAPPKPWGLTREQEEQDTLDDPFNATKYDDIDYDNPGMYDSPDDPELMGIDCPNEELTSNVPYPVMPTAAQDTDCILVSGPPTPAAPKPTAGFRPPERANRVDFITPNLVTDSFGMTGGRCLPDGSVTFAPQKAKHTPLPRDTVPLDEDALQKLSKEAIRVHAKRLFDMNIPKHCLKEEIINRYLNLTRNANKPGAPQQTKLSFAAATSNNNNNRFIPVPQRQTTPSAWSSSQTPPPRNPRPLTKPRSNTTTWIVRPRLGSNGLAERPFDGSGEKLSDWYRQRLQANTGDSKPSLTLLSGKWAAGPKSIFSLIFAGNVPFNILRSYAPLFLEKFDRDHYFHPAEDMKKIALFNIPMKRDSLGNVPTRHDLYKEIMRGGSLAGLDYFDGPCWTPNSRNNPDATTGVAHIMVRAPTDKALMTFFKRNTYMFNARIASQTAIPPRPFTQCTRCHRLNHTTDNCRLPNTTSVCSHCGSLNHKSAQHKLQCKEIHDGPSCSCPPRCFLCRNTRKTPSQFTGHTALDPSCPLIRYTFIPSGTTDTNPTLTHV
jgi:hypothetical protein